MNSTGRSNEVADIAHNLPYGHADVEPLTEVETHQISDTNRDNPLFQRARQIADQVLKECLPGFDKADTETSYQISSHYLASIANRLALRTTAETARDMMKIQREVEKLDRSFE